MRLIKEQHPQLDIRFIFSNSKTRISKNQKQHMACGVISMDLNTQTNMFQRSGYE